MKDKELKKILLTNSVPGPDERKKAQTIELFAKNTVVLRIRYQRSFLQQLTNQIPYISKFMWAVYAIFMAVLIYIYMAGLYSINSLLAFSTLTPFLTAMAFCEVVKSYYSKMWELEQSCTYNLQQIISMRLIITGVANYLILLIFFVCCISSSINVGLFLFLIVIPYQCENIVFFLLLRHFRSSDKSGFILMSIAVLMSGLIFMAITLVASPNIHFENFINTGNSLLLSAITFGMMMYFMISINKEDSALWN